MSTVYKIELVSHFVNYTEKDLENILIKAIKTEEIKMGIKSNEITVEIKSRN